MTDFSGDECMKYPNVSVKFQISLHVVVVMQNSIMKAYSLNRNLIQKREKIK